MAWHKSGNWWVAYLVLSLTLPGLVPSVSSSVPAPMVEPVSCNSFRQVDDAREFGIGDGERLLVYDSGYIYSYEITTGFARRLPFAETRRSWRSSGPGSKADTFRIPRMSPSGRLISYGSTYSSRNLSQSVHFVWSLTLDKMVSTFLWQPNWIHFIGWLSDEELVFQTTSNTFDVVDLEGEPSSNPIVVDDLQLNIPYDPWGPRIPQLSSFYLWSTLSSAGNVFQIYRSHGDPEDFRAIGYDLIDRSVFYEKGVDDWFWRGGGAMLQNPEQLTPAWSHAGTVLAIPLLGPSVNSNLFLLSSEGRIDQLTDLENSETARPVWSGDDSLILFWRFEIGGSESVLHVIEVSSGQLSALDIVGDGFDSPIASRPFGRAFVFLDRAARELVYLDFDSCTRLAQPLRDSMLDWFMLDWFSLEAYVTPWP